MGLAYLFVIGLYVLVSSGVVAWAVRYARKNGKSTKRWGWGAALVMYNIVFWDWIPTVAVHQYYCATEAGFWVYKTLEQWKAENPAVAVSLPASSSNGSSLRFEPFDDGRGKRDIYVLNDRFNWVVTQQDIISLLPIIRGEQQVKDVAKNEVLARYVDFGTGNSVKYFDGMPLKVWLHNGNCRGGAMNGGKISTFMEAASFLGKK